VVGARPQQNAGNYRTAVRYVQRLVPVSNNFLDNI